MNATHPPSVSSHEARALEDRGGLIADLRSRIGLPVQIQFREIQWPMTSTLQIQRRSAHPLQRAAFTGAEFERACKEEIRALADQYTTELRRRCYNWYNENFAALDAGEHRFRDALVDSAEMLLAGECRLIVVIRNFVNENLFARGTGTHDHVSQTIVAGHGLTDVHLDFAAIKATWREVPQGYVLPRCKRFYGLVTKLRPESLDSEEPFVVQAITAMPKD